MKKIIAILVVASLGLGTLFAQDSPSKKHAEKAAKETKKAVKETGKEIKKEGKEIKQDAKKEVNKL